jgi:GWxTD domain-containing protein
MFISRKPYESPLLGIVQRDTIVAAQVIPFIGHFNIGPLTSGNYYVSAILENNQGITVAQRSMFFQRSNKSPETARDSAATDSAEQNITYLDLNATFVAKYSFVQIRAILKMMLPVVSPSEANIIHGFLKKPDETYMRYFIFNFWKDQDSKNPKKAWDEYSSKVREVNKLFGYGHLPGYETERGMIYLKYGKPTNRIVVENEQGSLPYEVWQYNSTAKQGSGSFLIFYRPPNMINDFRLLHATIPGEIRNAQWRQILYTNGSNPAARAEQFNIR